MPQLGSYLRNNAGPVNFSDYKHASRLYIDGAYKLMPKAGWLYYVSFEIQSNVIKDLIFGGRKKHAELGILVKQADLPKFQINTETMNQYNRKTIIQKNIAYQPISFAFHDDSSNTVNDMWINYYRYYYNDNPKEEKNIKTALEGLAGNAINRLVGGTVGGVVGGLLGLKKDNASGPYGNTKYKTAGSAFDPFRYGLNTKNKKAEKKPFFKSITLYQLNRQQFYSYQLVNPIIKTWEHDRLDQTQGARFAESRMTVEYESVYYGKGSVSRDNPAGFATFHYDTTPSPLGVGKSGLKSLFNDALSGVKDVFGDILNSTDAPDSGLFAALGAVTAVGVGNLTGIVSSNFSSQSRSNTGYSTLNGVGYTPQSSVNGLGANLNLNLGNNPATAGQTNAAPVSLASTYIPQTLPNGARIGDGVFTNQYNGTGVFPLSATPVDASAAMTETQTQLATQVSAANISAPSEDNTPLGTTPAPGKYFSMPAPLPDTNVYSASNISATSTVNEVTTALDKLNTAWANDNDFVAKQQINPAKIDAKLAAATSQAEFNVIKSEANSAIAATKSLQLTVDNKYQAEYTRLSNLLTAKKTDVSGKL